jgi:hypothetical protein
VGACVLTTKPLIVGLARRQRLTASSISGTLVARAVANVSIPEAEPGDSEALTSALQNAALFARLGDDEETLHWLKRAAESAGASDDDRRMLALARAAADFSEALRGASRAPPSPPKSPVQAPARRPPAPSTRVAPLPAARAATPAKLPPVNANHSRAPIEREPSTVTPSSPAVSERTPLAPSAKRSAPVAVQMPSGLRPPAKPSATPVPTTPSLVSAPVNGASATAVSTHLRQAARVSVVASPTEPGTFRVSLLPDGAAVPAGSFEALLIASHAGDTPFSATPTPPSSEPLTPRLRKAPAAQ